MQANSRQVSSNQPHLHPALAATVRKHLASADRRPVPDYSRQAYERLRQVMAGQPRPLVLDSFCGTGLSSALLAERFADHLVVGIDKSAHRLSKSPQRAPDNCLLLRADCEDIWTLLAADGVTLSRHYLLYPNPWPKSGHLKRRVHGHPAFRALCALGGAVELRSNWALYVEEFGVAMTIAGATGSVQQVADTGADLSLFERKYRRSGHRLWRYRGTLPPTSAAGFSAAIPPASP